MPLYSQLRENFIEAAPKPNERVLELIHNYKLKAFKEGSNDWDLVSTDLKSDFIIDLYLLLCDEGFYANEVKSIPTTGNQVKDFQTTVLAMCKAANCGPQVLSSGLWITLKSDYESLEQNKIKKYAELMEK